MSSTSNSDALQLSGHGGKFSMPVVGLGTWKGTGLQQAVVAAIDAGYRLFDCAADYGNESDVGAGLAEAIGSGKVTRDELFVTSKLWNTFHAREHVIEGVKRTLADLKLDYLDLYLIHFPISLAYVSPDVSYPPGWVKEHSGATVQETWQAMEELVALGLVRNIGVSNFNCGLLMDLLKFAKIRPAVNQLELHPYLQQARLVNFCQRNDIHVTAYSSFGQISYLPLGQEKRFPCLLSEEPTIRRIADAHGKTPAQVILRWTTMKNVAIIPKSVDPARLLQNRTLDFTLTDDEVSDINKLDKGNAGRFNDPAAYFDWPIWD